MTFRTATIYFILERVYTLLSRRMGRSHVAKKMLLER